jgi:peptidoglycan/LPS O-acetylase OafA/YrhL
MTHRPNALAHTSNEFRGDIDGLRALAIILVVAFHAGVPGFSGGFIGVDVFFVISGFLITRNLIAEIEKTGGVNLLSFWAKRIRRLLPALSAMVVVTLALALAIQSPIEWQMMIKQGASAALYSSNVFFAFYLGYFDEDVTNSPFLHTWSLSLEEQFYVFWPLMLLGVYLLARRKPRDFRNWLVLGLGAVVVVSLALCIVLTNTVAGAPHAFYSLPTRAWEFAAAGLLAAVPLPRVLQGRGVRYGCVLVGLALLLIGMTVLSPATGYPGAWALLPVVGTLLLIAGYATGDQSFPPTRVLSSAPMQWFGRVSYSWYLWHWPFIALAVVGLDRDDVGLKIAAAMVALPVAALMYRFFENPLRFSPWLTRSLGRTYAFGGAATALALFAAVGAWQYTKTRVVESPYRELATLKRDRMKWCPVNATTPGGVDYCVRGAESGEKTVVLIGDSHALQWVPAFAQTAEQLGIRLVVRWRSLCPATPVRTTAYGIKNEPCYRYQAKTAQLLEELQPDAVVISQFRGYLGRILDDRNVVPDTSAQLSLWARGLQEYLTAMQQAGIPTGVVLDNPRLPQDPILCFARGGSNETCAFPLEEDRNRLVQGAEHDVLRRFTQVPVFAVVDDLCPDGVCAVRTESMYTMFDTHHLTEAFTLTQTGRIGELFLRLLRGKETTG